MAFKIHSLNTGVELAVVEASNCFKFKIMQLYHLYMCKFAKYHHIRILLKIIFDIIKLFNIHSFIVSIEIKVVPPITFETCVDLNPK